MSNDPLSPQGTPEEEAAKLKRPSVPRGTLPGQTVDPASVDLHGIIAQEIENLPPSAESQIAAKRTGEVVAYLQARDSELGAERAATGPLQDIEMGTPTAGIMEAEEALKRSRMPVSPTGAPLPLPEPEPQPKAPIEALEDLVSGRPVPGMTQVQDMSPELKAQTNVTPGQLEQLSKYGTAQNVAAFNQMTAILTTGGTNEDRIIALGKRSDPMAHGVHQALRGALEIRTFNTGFRQSPEDLLRLKHEYRFLQENAPQQSGNFAMRGLQGLFGSGYPMLKAAIIGMTAGANASRFYTLAYFAQQGAGQALQKALQKMSDRDILALTEEQIGSMYNAALPTGLEYAAIEMIASPIESYMGGDIGGLVGRRAALKVLGKAHRMLPLLSRALAYPGRVASEVVEEYFQSLTVDYGVASMAGEKPDWSRMNTAALSDMIGAIPTVMFMVGGGMALSIGGRAFKAAAGIPAEPEFAAPEIKMVKDGVPLPALETRVGGKWRVREATEFAPITFETDTDYMAKMSEASRRVARYIQEMTGIPMRQAYAATQNMSDAQLLALDSDMGVLRRWTGQFRRNNTRRKSMEDYLKPTGGLQYEPPMDRENRPGEPLAFEGDGDPRLATGAAGALNVVLDETERRAQPVTEAFAQDAEQGKPLDLSRLDDMDEDALYVLRQQVESDERIPDDDLPGFREAIGERLATLRLEEVKAGFIAFAKPEDQPLLAAADETKSVLVASTHGPKGSAIFYDPESGALAKVKNTATPQEVTEALEVSKAVSGGRVSLDSTRAKEVLTEEEQRFPGISQTKLVKSDADLLLILNRLARQNPMSEQRQRALEDAIAIIGGGRSIGGVMSPEGPTVAMEEVARNEVARATGDLAEAFRRIAREEYIHETLQTRYSKAELQSMLDKDLDPSVRDFVKNLHARILARYDRPGTAYDSSTPQGRTALMDELVSQLYAMRATDPNPWNRYVQAVAKSLMGKGVGKGLTEPEMTGIVQDALAARRTTPMVGNAPEDRFSVGEKPLFYSALQRGIEQTSFKQAMPGDQFLNKVRGLPGVKAQEIEESGLADWLQMQKEQGKPVTKEAATEFLKGNGVRVEVVRHGGGVGEELDEISLRMFGVTSVNLTEQQAYAVDREFQKNTDTKPPKYHGYAPPGGVPGTYREVLLRLPNSKRDALRPAAEAAAAKAGLSLNETSIRKLEDAGVDRDSVKDFEKWFFEKSGGWETDYTSPHWSEPNVLAHMLMDERRIPVDVLEKTQPELAARLRVAGKTEARALHMIEGQSDWLQDAASTGMRGVLPKGWDVFSTGDASEPFAVRNPAGEVLGGGMTREEAIDRATSDLVPKGPFRGDAWKRLVIRTMLAEAADGGYDMLTWSTGADRAAKWGSERVEWKSITPTKSDEDWIVEFRYSDTENWTRVRGFDTEAKAVAELEKLQKAASESPHQKRLQYRVSETPTEKTWTVAGTEQSGGEHQGQNIEALARERGMLLEQHGKTVRTKDDLRKIVTGILRNPEAGKVDKLTNRIWDRMQAEPEGTSMPRREFFEFLYDKSFVQEANDIVRKMDKGARVGETAISLHPQGYGQEIDEAQRPSPTSPVHAIPITDAVRGMASEPQAMFALGESPSDAPIDFEAERQSGGSGLLQRMGLVFRSDKAVPVDKISLSKDIPQFKGKVVNIRTGETQPLGGKFDPLGVAPIVLIERLNGNLEVTTGRHRLALARRSGSETISAHIVREADGFTPAKAMMVDAILNIREGNGEIEDFVTFFKNSGMERAEAEAEGLLARDKGRTGWNLGKLASDDLRALWEAGKIGQGAASAIAEGAPNQPERQAAAVRYAKGKNLDQVKAFMQAMQRIAPAAASQGDLLGFDQGEFDQMAKLAEVAAESVAAIKGELNTLMLARSMTEGKKRAAILEKHGFKGGDLESVEDRIYELQQDLVRWEHWSTDPSLRQEIEAKAGVVVKEQAEPEPEPVEPPPAEAGPAEAGRPTVDDLRQRDPSKFREGEMFPGDQSLRLTGERGTDQGPVIAAQEQAALDRAESEKAQGQLVPRGTPEGESPNAVQQANQVGAGQGQVSGAVGPNLQPEPGGTVLRQRGEVPGTPTEERPQVIRLGARFDSLVEDAIRESEKADAPIAEQLDPGTAVPPAPPMSPGQPPIISEEPEGGEPQPVERVQKALDSKLQKAGWAKRFVMYAGNLYKFAKKEMGRDPALDTQPEFRESRRHTYAVIPRKIAEFISITRPKVFDATEKKHGKAGVQHAMDIFYTRNLLAQAQSGMSVMEDLTVAELSQHLAWLEHTASPEVMGSAKELTALMKRMYDTLVARGQIPEESDWRTYAPHQVAAFMPQWFGIEGFGLSVQQKFGEPYRGYTKQAMGSPAVINTDESAVWYYVSKVLADNEYTDWALSEAGKYNAMSKWMDELDRQPRKPEIQKPHTRGSVTVDGQRHVFLKWGRGSYSIASMSTDALLGFAEEVVNKEYADALRQQVSGYSEADQAKLLAHELHAKGLFRQGKSKLFLLPAPIAENLMGDSSMGREFGTFVRHATAYTRIWKSSVLAWNMASYQGNNLFGDTMNALSFDLGAIPHLGEAFQMGRRMFYPNNWMSWGANLSGRQRYVLQRAREMDVANAGFFESETVHHGSVVPTGQSMSRLAPAERMVVGARKIWQSYVRLSEFRESVARLAIFSHQMSRIEKGMPVMPLAGLKIDGLQPETAAAYVARETLVDYASTGKNYRMLVSGFAFPFARFYEANFRNHLRAGFRSKYWARYWSKQAVPYAFEYWWNNVAGGEERRRLKYMLPERDRKRVTLILGLDESGTKIRVWQPQVPAQLAYHVIGLDSIKPILEDLAEKRITTAEAGKRFVNAIPGGTIEMTASLMNPGIRFVEGLLTNRDPVFGFKPISSDAMHRLLIRPNKFLTSAWDLRGEIGAYFGSCVASPLMAFVGQNRDAQPRPRNNLLGGFFAAMRKGPLNWTSVIGLREIPLYSGTRAEAQEEKSDATFNKALLRDGMMNVIRKGGFDGLSDEKLVWSTIKKAKDNGITDNDILNLKLGLRQNDTARIYDLQYQLRNTDAGDKDAVKSLRQAIAALENKRAGLSSGGQTQ